ncbi:MAG: hypothetical protein GX039_04360 [Clostridia bacterium]|nr:hypothetical protein [Clostridia bacterium]
MRLPEAVFHRTGTAIGDFRYLLQRYEQDNSIFNPETYRQILFDLAIAYRRLEMDTAVEEILTQLPASERDKFIQYSRLQYSFNRL